MDRPYVLPFIRREHYAAFRSLISTGLPLSYDDWLADFVRVRRQHQERDQDTYECHVSPTELEQFCALKGLPLTTESLVEFARDLQDRQIAAWR